MSAQEQQYHVASDEQVVEDLDPENEGYLAPSKCGMFRATQPVVLVTRTVEYEYLEYVCCFSILTT